jgi:hypothetical protein
MNNTRKDYLLKSRITFDLASETRQYIVIGLYVHKYTHVMGKKQ